MLQSSCQNTAIACSNSLKVYRCTADFDFFVIVSLLLTPVASPSLERCHLQTVGSRRLQVHCFVHEDPIPADPIPREEHCCPLSESLAGWWEGQDGALGGGRRSTEEWQTGWWMTYILLLYCQWRVM